jgi:hypothetical protein
MIFFQSNHLRGKVFFYVSMIALALSRINTHTFRVFLICLEPIVRLRAEFENLTLFIFKRNKKFKPWRAVRCHQCAGAKRYE